MENYKPTIADIKYAKNVNDNIIWRQVLNPAEIKEAHKRLFGFMANTQQQARIKVFNWFQYIFKPSMLIETNVDTVETSIPADSTSIGTVDNLSKQTHSEEDQIELLDTLFTLGDDVDARDDEAIPEVHKVNRPRKRNTKKK